MDRIDPTEMLLIAGTLAVGAALVMAARLLRAWMARSSAAQTALRYPGYVLLAIGSLGGLVILMNGMGFFAWLIMMGIWIRAAVHYRATQRRNLFSGLALAVDKRMPLGAMAVALAQEPDAGFSMQARKLAHQLERGDTLSDALAQSWRILPPESALVAKVGAESGDLAAALEATTYGSRFDRSVLQPLVARSAYVLVILSYFAAILIFLQFKIGPSFVKIFDDFQAPISRPFILLVRLSQSAWPFELLLGLMLLLPLYVWLQWRGTLFPRLPGLRRVVDWVDVGPLLRMLALAAERHRPLSGMFDAIALFHPKRSIRRRVTHIAREVD
ncbi:MAG TPA: type II secretion system F family protein, partial [Pirellulales bacterium]|nr:type II secretion system F family protein [Pirellulales bacterium]